MIRLFKNTIDLTEEVLTCYSEATQPTFFILLVLHIEIIHIILIY